MKRRHAKLALLAAASCAALALLSGHRAMAQTEPPAPAAGASREEERSRLVFFTSFGWQNHMITDRLCPIRIEIGPMDDPVAGTVMIDHEQDSTQLARITMPFAATPGKPTRVEAITAIPAYASRLRVLITDDRGRLLATQTYGSRDFPLPTRVDSSAGLMVGVGRTGVVDSLTQWTSMLNEATTTDGTAAQRAAVQSLDYRFKTMQRARVAMPIDLATSWAGYDGVSILVVDAPAAADADPRAVDAVRKWVLRGGKLVLVAGSPGDSWRAWLPQDSPLPIEVSEPRTADLPKEAADAITSFARTVSNAMLSSGAEAATIPPPAARLSARAIRVSEAGASIGWTARWNGGDSGPLLAEGPVGFGWVTVIGFDPARATDTPETARDLNAASGASGAVWREALATPASHVYERAMALSTQWGYGATPQSEAVDAALEQVGHVPALGAGVFVGIAACVLLLAVMVGPGDYFILKRLRAGHRSWMTALGWAALASLGAYFVPRTIRTDPNIMHRLTFVDAICAPDQTPGMMRPALTASLGVTGIYAAESGTFAFEHAGVGSWWRGVAVSSFYGNDLSGAGVVPVVQSAAGGPLGSERAGALSAVPLQIWTFRTFLDLDSPALPLSVRIRKDGEDLGVSVVGLPEGATVTRAAARLGEAWYTLPEADTPANQLIGGDEAWRMGYAGKARPRSTTIVQAPALGAHDGGSWSATFPASLSGPEAPPSWKVNVASGDYGYYRSAVTDAPGPLLDLPGVLERAGAIDAMLGTGRFAVLYLKVEGWTMEPALSRPARTSHARILRLVVPLAPQEAGN